MEGRRGRGGHWKRGGGGRGDAETSSSGEHRGRGRGGHHHRGRGKRDHRRGRGRDFGPPADFRNFRRVSVTHKKISTAAIVSAEIPLTGNTADQIIPVIFIIIKL